MVSQHCQSSLQQRKVHDITYAMKGEPPVSVITSSPDMSNKIQLMLDESGGVNGMQTSNLLVDFIFSQSTSSGISMLDALLLNIVTQFPSLTIENLFGDFCKPAFFISSYKQTNETHLVNKYNNDFCDQQGVHTTN